MNDTITENRERDFVELTFKFMKDNVNYKKIMKIQAATGLTFSQIMCTLFDSLDSGSFISFYKTIMKRRSDEEKQLKQDRKVKDFSKKAFGNKYSK